MSHFSADVQIKTKLFDLKAGDRFRFTDFNEKEFTITRTFTDSIGRIVYFTDGKESFATVCGDEVWKILPVTGGFEVPPKTVNVTLGELEKKDEFLWDNKKFVKHSDHPSIKSMFCEYGYYVQVTDESGNLRFCTSEQLVQKIVKPLLLKDLKPGEKFNFVGQSKLEWGYCWKNCTKVHGHLLESGSGYIYVVNEDHLIGRFTGNHEVERV